jgi:hypothetical protein
VAHSILYSIRSDLGLILYGCKVSAAHNASAEESNNYNVQFWRWSLCVRWRNAMVYVY